MRTKLIFIAFLLFLAGSATAEQQIGIYAERLHDLDVTTCPRCGKAIRAGAIHQDAEADLVSALRQGLADRGISYSLGRNDGKSIEVFVFRYQERQGGNFSVERPASVGFHLHLFDGKEMVKVFQFDDTQQPLMDNILKLGTFLRRGMKWITASQLAEEGIEKGIGYLQEDLK